MVSIDEILEDFLKESLLPDDIKAEGEQFLKDIKEYFRVIGMDTPKGEGE